MPYLILIFSTLCVSSSSLIGSLYNRKNEGRTGADGIYNLILTLSALAVWGIASCFSFRFHLPTLLFSLGFGLSYAITHFSTLRALRYGSVSMTSLASQFSLIGTAIWGVLFWGDDLAWTGMVGLVLVAFSLVLCLRNTNEEKTVDKKWLFYALLMLLGNMGCVVIQKSQIRAYGEEYGNMLMLFAMLFSSLVVFVAFLRSDKRDIKPILKKSAHLPVLAGVCNAVLNLCVVYMAMRLPSGLVYPVIAVGGIGICVLASMLFFREKISRIQWLGLAVGTVAVLFLSI